MSYEIDVLAKSSKHQCLKCNAHGHQCIFEPIEGSKYCQTHTDEKARTSAITGHKERMRMYRLNLYQARLQEFKENPEAKSVSNELGILRILLEQLVNDIDSPAKAIIHQARIADTADKVVKAATVLARLEKQCGMVLDKGAAIALGGRIVEIIAEEVKDPRITERIAKRIIKTIQEAEPEDDDE